MKIATWHDEKYQSYVCPKCRLLRQNFPIFELDGVKVFLCMQPSCGTLFVPKSERARIDIKALMEAQDNPLLCDVLDCGFVAKSKAGLGAHMRSH